MAVKGETVTGGPGAPLHLNCYCTVVKDQSPLQVKSLIELTAEEQETLSSSRTRVPLRFVAVIDESGSMASTIGNESLIYKMKIFARVMVRKMKAEDMLGIVGFDSDARVLLPITQMDKEGKKAAMQSIESLSAKTVTNLCEGILTGVKLFDVAEEGAQYRNGMVVFTDGIANEGITDADGIVSAFNSTIQQTFGSNFCLPISTLTIGDYKPDLLFEISQRLGSDAFFWINDMNTFETDMMIPFFLRETSLVSDVHVTLHALNGATFDVTKMATDRMVAQTQQSDTSPVEYYIHDISADMAKHVPCYITINAKEKKMQNTPIMEVHVTYRDYNNAPRELRLTITFINVTLAELRKKFKQQTKSQDNTLIAYMDSNVPMAITEVTRAETAIAKIAQEEWRTTTVNTINKAAYYFDLDEIIMSKNAIQETTDYIVQRKTEVNTVVTGKPAVLMCDRADSMIEALGHCLTVIGAGGSEGWQTMKTMSSSLANESPATGKIFPGEARPFAPPAMEAELENYQKIVDQQKQQLKQKPPPKPKTFKDRHVAVSEKLSKAAQEKIKELIIEHGGKPVPFVKRKAAYNMLVCSRAEFNDKSVKVRDALENQIPIVSEEYIHESIKQEKMLDFRDYRLI
ncbi:Hypp1785 [Branchiostoma lanceolatum]|uniref:Hypp1785 protein n=1 Tax=Branchiostoma lanceolatum TaxID=7740 RepID=A0A8J9ZKJ8_BRALA|nr:Hypp1785 [Branchiostoma lanceolatum]